MLTGRTPSTLEKAKDSLEKDYGIKVLTVVADGGDEASAQLVAEKAMEAFGRIDTLVNNAQNSKSGVLLVDHTKEDFDQAIYSGLYATFFYMKACYPYLKESKGSVVNFASGAGIVGKVGQSSYAAAKEGIRGLSRVAAAEWGPDGVRVNIVAPLAMTKSLEQWREKLTPLCMKRPSRISPLGASAIRKPISAESAYSSPLKMPPIFSAKPSPSKAEAAAGHSLLLFVPIKRCSQISGVPLFHPDQRRRH